MNFIDKCYRMFMAITVALFAVLPLSCSKDKTDDGGGLTLSYARIIDVGPSASGVVARPVFSGNAPYNYLITKVTYEGEECAAANFKINSSNGSVSIADASALNRGLYKISICCTSNKVTYSFVDALTINLMGSAPQGITISPARLTINCAQAMTSDEEPLPTAKVQNDGSSTITSYEIAKGSHSDFFAVSSDGEISVVRGTKELTPGIYKVSLKLTTDAGDSFILENALEVNLTAMSLQYATPIVELFEESAEHPQTSYTSLPPIVSGVAINGLEYEIKRITPATDKIAIDKTTGVISVAIEHGFKMDQEYVVDIAVLNSEAQDIFDFDKALTLKITGVVTPISNFRYADSEVIKADAFEIKYKEDFVGTAVTFTFGTVDVALIQGGLSINAKTGAISAAKGNTLPVGEFDVQVRASNREGATSTRFKLKINDINKNIFTYIKYGNNIGLKGDTYAFQYRARSAAALQALNIPAPQTDINPEATVEWSINFTNGVNGISIDGATGKLNMAKAAFSPTPQGSRSGFITVKVTTGKDTPMAFSMTIPVFFNVSLEIDGVTIDYTPFAIKVNPKTGCCSNAPVISGVTDMSKFLMGFRRTILYTDLGGNLKTGQADKDNTCFMYELWSNYYSPSVPSVGNCLPMSYFGNEKTLDKPLAYFDAKDYSVVVNPEKWKSSTGHYANGILTAQIQYDLTGSSANITGTSPYQIYPVILWFDEKF